MLGLYVSDHPLIGAVRALRASSSARSPSSPSSTTARCAPSRGVVTGLQRKYTKRGDLMATFVLEDLAAAIEVMVFPKTMLNYGELLAPDAIVTVKGRRRSRRHAEADRDGDHPARVAPRLRAAATVRVSPPRSRRGSQRLKGILPRTPATARCSLHLLGPDKETALRLGDEFRCDPRTGLFAELARRLRHRLHRIDHAVAVMAAVICDALPDANRDSWGRPGPRAAGSRPGWRVSDTRCCSARGRSTRRGPSVTELEKEWGDRVAGA